MATAAKDKILAQANDTIDALADRAKEALQRAANGAEQARGSAEGAWRVAEKARVQAGDLAGEVYSRGRQTARAVGQRIEDQPLMALVVVGLFGLMVGYMLRGK